MAKTIDVDLLQKERDDLEKSLTQARQNVETAKNQVMSIIGAIQMTDYLKKVTIQEVEQTQMVYLKKRLLKYKSH